MPASSDIATLPAALNSSNAAEDTSSVASTESSSSSCSQAKSQKQAASGKTKETIKLRELLVLPKSFDPSDNDVIIGRGKRARTHEGNKRLRGLIAFMIPEYQAAGSNKDEKSFIIKEIVMQIRKSSPDGGFVKFDKTKDRWVEVGCFLAREKISQTFRDAMGDSYSSSNPYKRKRRSFEKKHNAVVDIIKRRRGTSPTSVSQSGSSSPPTPPSPESYRRINGELPPLPQLAPQPSTAARVAAIATPVSTTPQQQQQQSSSLLDMYRRPGQIGFARRLSMQMGMPAGRLPVATTPQRHQAYQRHITPSPHHRDQSPSMNHSLLAGVRGLPMRHPHYTVAGSPHSAAAAADAMHPLGVPPHRRSSLPAGFNSALMSELIQRQRLVRNAAMVRPNLSSL